MQLTCSIRRSSGLCDIMHNVGGSLSSPGRSLTYPSVPRQFPSGPPLAHCVFCLGGRLFFNYMTKREDTIELRRQNPILYRVRPIIHFQR